VTTNKDGRLEKRGGFEEEEKGKREQLSYALRGWRLKQSGTLLRGKEKKKIRRNVLGKKGLQRGDGRRTEKQKGGGVRGGVGRGRGTPRRALDSREQGAKKDMGREE